MSVSAGNVPLVPLEEANVQFWISLSHHRALKAETAMKMQADVKKLTSLSTKITFNVTCLGPVLIRT